MFKIRYLQGKNINREGIQNYYNNNLKLRVSLGEIKIPALVKYKFESFPIRGAIVYPTSYDYFGHRDFGTGPGLLVLASGRLLGRSAVC